MKQADGILICQSIYPVLSENGYFPALTGGLLYKEGERKDCDIVIFRHRQEVASFELRKIEDILTQAGFTEFEHYGFVTKAKFGNYSVDLFNPETESSEDSYGDLNENHSESFD